MDGAAYDGILTTLTSAITPQTIATVLVAALGISVGLAFFWWAGRRVIKIIMAGFKKGRVTV